MNNCSGPDIPLLAPPAAAILVQKMWLPGNEPLNTTLKENDTLNSVGFYLE